MLIVIGDSHIRTFTGIADSFIGQQQTIFNVVNGQLDFVFEGKIVPIRPDIKYLFIFGEIDCRMHLFSHQDTMKQLAQDYISKLQKYRVNLIISSITPPTNFPIPAEFESITYYNGTIEQRVDMTKRMNGFLKNRCWKRKIKFLDIYDYYALPDGSLNPSYSDGWTHIDPKHNSFIKEKLKNLIL